MAKFRNVQIKILPYADYDNFPNMEDHLFLLSCILDKLYLQMTEEDRQDILHQLNVLFSQWKAKIFKGDPDELEHVEFMCENIKDLVLKT